MTPKASIPINYLLKRTPRPPISKWNETHPSVSEEMSDLKRELALVQNEREGP